VARSLLFAVCSALALARLVFIAAQPERSNVRGPKFNIEQSALGEANFPNGR